MGILRILSVLCCFALFSAGVSGQNFLKKKQPEQTGTLRNKIREDKISKLIADRVDVTKKKIVSDDLTPISYVTNEELVEAESLLFPADELYDSNWDTRWVNPFRSQNITIPDSFKIDCSSFVSPIDNEIKVTSPYGPRRRRMHRGIDLKVYVGDTIRAAFSGKIRIKRYERRGYGYYLVIRHPNGLETIYGHLSKFLVSENEIVRAGQPIALGGNTGRSRGSHLHFETRFLGEAIDPSHIIDFENGTPHKDFYVFRKNNFQNRSNIYTSTSEHIVYHRVKKGETLGHISRKYHLSIAELCRLNGLKRSSTLRIGQTIRCGKAQVKTSRKEKQPKITPPNKTTESTTAAHSSRYHKVEANETLMSIARKHDTTVDELCKLNNIQATTPLRPGQSLCYHAAKRKDSRNTEEKEAAENIMADNETEETESPINTPEEIIVADNTPNEEKNHRETSRFSASNSQKEASYHSVKYGETLYAIARHYDISVDELCRLNNITRNETIQVGQQLRYKGNIEGSERPKMASSSKAKVSPVYHRIKKGDTLGSIARKHGLSVSQLCKLNNIRTTTTLRIGRSLRCS